MLPLLIIGAGGVGQAIATRAKAFGMRVWGSRRRPEPIPNFDKIVGVDEWGALLPEVDYLVIALKQRLTELFLDNLQRYQAGLPLRNVVDKQADY
jgi:pyruvate/2-oxoglutarate dehydrogenase complex dihydrolipoamide dehydrogenase (E3) component